MAFAAFLLHRPVVLHESDAVMGVSNRLAARVACQICTAFEGASLHPEKTTVTGNPVRPELREGSRERGYALTGFKPGLPVLLVWGGSQGAREINGLVASHLTALCRHFRVVHITGRGNPPAGTHERYRAFEYLGEELKDIYAIADLCVSRAGANSLAELAYVELPAVLIPLAGSANDHQRRNAEHFFRAGAAVALNHPNRLPELLTALWHNEAQQKSMKEALRALSTPRAAERIGDLLMTISHSQ